MTRKPLDALRHHVTGAIERGEAVAVVEQRAATHTPGPWWFSATGRERTSFAIGAGDVEHALIGGMNCAENNARLVAASPDLLAALIELHKELHQAIRLDVKKHFSLMVADAAASKAIRKAKGE